MAHNTAQNNSDDLPSYHPDTTTPENGHMQSALLLASARAPAISKLFLPRLVGGLRIICCRHGQTGHLTLGTAESQMPSRLSWGIGRAATLLKTLLQYFGKSLEALPGVAYPGFRDNRSTLNTKTG